MTKRLLMAALLLLAPVCAYADGGCVHDIALQMRTAGLTVISGASVKVCTDASCNSLATIYTDDTLGITTTNPVTADTRGNYSYCATSGTYHEKITNSVDGTSYFKHYVSAVGTTALSALKSATKDKGFVNVVNDCGATGNGVTDDGPTILTCIANNPGKIMFFPKMRTTPCSSGSGGGCVGSVDYFSSVQLSGFLNGSGMVGGARSFWTGGVRIKFAAGVGGILVLNAYGTSFEELELQSASACWDVTNFTASTPPTSTMMTGNGANGMTIAGGLTTVRNMTIDCFEGNGIAIMGNGSIPSSGQPDQFSITNVKLTLNRGYGFMARGGDSQAGKTQGLMCYGNQMGCIGDFSQTGNTHDSPVSQGDARGFISAGTTQVVTSQAVTSGVMAITTAVAPANGVQTVGNYIKVIGSTTTAPSSTAITSTTVNTGVATVLIGVAPPAWATVGSWVNLAGELDATFDQPCIITSTATSPSNRIICSLVNYTGGAGLHADGLTTGGTISQGTDTICRITGVVGSVVSCAVPNADMAATGGNVRTASADEVYEFYRGMYGFAAGAFIGSIYSNQTTFIMPYCESTSRFPNFNTGSLILGRTNCETNLATNQGITWNSIGSGGGGITVMRAPQGVQMQNKVDQTWNLDIDIGRTASQVGQLRFLDRSTVKFCLSKATNNAMFLMDACSASNSQIVFASGAGIDIIPKSGQALRIVGGSSDVQFTGTDFTADATISSAGKGTFNGGVVPSSTSSTLAFFKVATHATVDLASVASAACTAVQTETISGAALGDRCSVASGIATADGSFYACNVTATDTVKWSYCNLSGGAIDRASDTYTIQVVR